VLFRSVRQFDDAASGIGFVQGIRLPDAPQESFTAHLHGIDAQARYRLERGDNGESKEVTGQTLIDQGIQLQGPKRSGVVWFYQRLDS